MITEVLTIVVLRTWKPFYNSRMSPPLLIAMVLVLMVTFALPYSPLNGLLGFRPLPPRSIALLGLISVLCVIALEVTRRLFHAENNGRPGCL